MTKILNLTQHKASKEQLEAGVVDLPEDDRKVLIELLTFKSLPTQFEINSRACDIANLLYRVDRECQNVMIGGAPYLMSYLEHRLYGVDNVNYMYSFSERVSVETTNEVGIVIKTNEFKHIGWVM